MSSDLVIGMAGSGGDGIVSAGESMMTAAALEGYSAILTKSFGSQIRGGESSCRVRLATQPVLNAGGTLDVAVALNWEDFLKFGAELPVDGRTTVIYEAASGVAPGELPLAGVVPREAVAGADRADRQGDGGDRPGQEHRGARAAGRLVRAAAGRVPGGASQALRQEERARS